jgi:AcrR family transcriptional regulator
MMAARTQAGPGPRASGSRGRIDKRQAILEAAFEVFARLGYAQACVQEIATEAGVAKPTVYNHLADKETLFQAAMGSAAERVTGAYLGTLEKLRDPGPDLAAALTETGRRLLRCYADPQAVALRRLFAAEINHFPGLLEVVHGPGIEPLAGALADRFAHLMLAGRLRTSDAMSAAEQYFSLLTGPMNLRSRFGTRRVSDAELRAIAGAAAVTFLRAFGVPAEVPTVE